MANLLHQQVAGARPHFRGRAGRLGTGGRIPADGPEVARPRQADDIGHQRGLADKPLGIEQDFGQVVEKARSPGDTRQAQVEEANI